MEAKTVTMPLSDFEELRSKAAQYTSLRNTIRSEVERNYERALNDISALYDKYYDKYSESEIRVRELEREIESLNRQLSYYKSRKWWQIWKL